MREIDKALQSMEVMTALLTDNFYESVWTNQEVGFAHGKGIPVISLKLGPIDPQGFMQPRQAVKASLENPDAAAAALFDVIKTKAGLDDRIRSGLLTTFIGSGSWAGAKTNFERMKQYSGYGPADAEKIIEAFARNPQLGYCFHLREGRLVSFLEQISGKKYKLNPNSTRIMEILPKKPKIDDEIPF